MTEPDSDLDDESIDAQRAFYAELEAHEESYPRAYLEPGHRPIYRRRHLYYEMLWCLDDTDGVKALPDGREIVVLPWSGNGGQLSIGRRTGFYDDTWDYETYRAALAAADAWDGHGEPDGWYRHPATGRRRPGGDPDAEFIRP